jgi:hypothetical protein
MKTSVQQYQQQGWDPTQAAILAAIDAALRQAQRAPTELAEVPPEAQALSDLVSLYEAKWPEICYVKGGSRARKAMDYVLRGDVLATGSDRNGHDTWLVAGHKCSKRGEWCECKDFAAPVIKFYGKLCCHRLAVALKTNWHGDKNHAALAYLSGVIEAAPGPFIDVLIERDYDYHGEGNRARIAGFWAHGMAQHNRLTPLEVLPVTLPQFQWVLTQLKWGMIDLPAKLPGDTDYYYRIAPGEGLLINEPLFWHRGRTWRMEDRERMRRLQLVDLAAHLDEWLNAPIAIELSKYDAKRVSDLRQRMHRESLQATEIWSALPESLRIAILENGGIEYAN